MTDIPPSTAPTSVALTRRWREVPVIVGLVLEARRECQRGRQRLGGAAVALSKVQSVDQRMPPGSEGFSVPSRRRARRPACAT